MEIHSACMLTHTSEPRNAVALLRAGHNNALLLDQSILAIPEVEAMNLLPVEVANVGMLDAGYDKTAHSLFPDHDHGHCLFLYH